MCVYFVMYWCCRTIIGAVEPLNTLCWRVWQCLSCACIRMVDAFNQRNCCPTVISDFDFDLYIWIFKSLFGITRNWYFIFYLQNIFLLCVSSASGWWWFCFCLKDCELINEIVFPVYQYITLFSFVIRYTTRVTILVYYITRYTLTFTILLVSFTVLLIFRYYITRFTLTFVILLVSFTVLLVFQYYVTRLTFLFITLLVSHWHFLYYSYHLHITHFSILYYSF